MRLQLSWKSYIFGKELTSFFSSNYYIALYTVIWGWKHACTDQIFCKCDGPWNSTLDQWDSSNRSKHVFRCAAYACIVIVRSIYLIHLNISLFSIDLSVSSFCLNLNLIYHMPLTINPHNAKHRLVVIFDACFVLVI